MQPVDGEQFDVEDEGRAAGDAGLPHRAFDGMSGWMRWTGATAFICKAAAQLVEWSFGITCIELKAGLWAPSCVFSYFYGNKSE